MKTYFTIQYYFITALAIGPPNQSLTLLSIYSNSFQRAVKNEKPLTLPLEFGLLVFKIVSPSTP